DGRARLPQPEGGLEDGADAGHRHPLVVVGDTAEHVRVRLEDFHASAQSIARLAASSLSREKRSRRKARAGSRSARRPSARAAAMRFATFPCSNKPISF